MTRVFETVLNISIGSLWLIFAVLCARFVLCKAPKWTRMLLWLLVAVRLVLPFAPESPLSLVPETAPIELSAEDEVRAEEKAEGLSSPAGQDKAEQTPVTPSPITPSVPDEPVGGETPEVLLDPVTPDVPLTPENPIKESTPVITEDGGEELYTAAAQTDSEEISVTGNVLTAVWIVGMALMTGYFVFNYMRLRLRLRDAVHSEGRLWHSDRIDSAFVFGFINPRVYMPFSIDKGGAAYVLAHEQAHIKRGDHIIKPLAFLILALHWFNPAVWVAYILFCKDVELACDEAAVRGMDAEKKNKYSHALVSLSTEKRGLSVYPINFGEAGIKDRVKNILNYKKPAFWIVIGALAVCVIVAVCFMTVRSDESTSAPADSAESTETTDSTEGTESTDGTEPTDATEPTGTDEPDVTPPEPVRGDISIVGAQSLPAGAKDVEFEVEEKYFGYSDYYAEYLDTVSAHVINSVDSEHTYKLRVFTEYNEFAEFADAVHERYETMDLSAYGNDFFEDSVLMIIVGDEPKRISLSGTELCIELEHNMHIKTYGVMTPAVEVAPRYACIIISKDDIEGVDTVSLCSKHIYKDLPEQIPARPREFSLSATTAPAMGEQGDCTVRRGAVFTSWWFRCDYQSTEVPLKGSNEKVTVDAIVYEDEFWLKWQLSSGNNLDAPDDGKNDIPAVFSRYDEEFFSEKALIMMSIPGSGHEHKLVFNGKKDGKLYFTVKLWKGVIEYDPEISFHTWAFAELEKSLMDGVSEIVFSAELTDEGYYDSDNIIGAEVRPKREVAQYDYISKEDIITGQSVTFEHHFSGDGYGTDKLIAPSFISANVQKVTVDSWDKKCTVGFDFFDSKYELRRMYMYFRANTMKTSLFKCLADAVDSSDFRDKVLVVLYRSFNSGGLGYNIDKIVKNGDELQFVISTGLYRYGDNYPSVIAQSVMLYWVDRDAFDGVNTISMYAEDMRAGESAGSYTHEHTYYGATCTEPATCKVCGETKGEALGHSYSVEATCTAGQSCSRCGDAVGSALGHDFYNNVCHRSGCGAIKDTEPGVIYVTDRAVSIEIGESAIEFKESPQVLFISGKRYIKISFTVRGSDYLLRKKVRVYSYDGGKIVANTHSFDGNSILIPYTEYGEYILDLYFGEESAPYYKKVSYPLSRDDLR